MNESNPKMDPSREKKSLRLRMTTLRRLSQAELGKVVGGQRPTMTGITICHTFTEDP